MQQQRRLPSEPLYVSRNHLEGSLCDVPLERILRACKKHLVTGVVRVHAGKLDGVVEIRAGAVDAAQLGDLKGGAALAAISQLRDGWYEVAQRLPDLTGDLATTAALDGEVDGVPLIQLMRHCEDNALTCTITVIGGFDRATIEYRAGDIARIEMNGFFDDDALTQVLEWPDARFRVAAPPLDLDVEGWPVTRRAPTVPQHIEVPPNARRGSTRSGEINVVPAPAPQSPPSPVTVVEAPKPLAPLSDALLLPPPALPRPTTVPALATRYRTGDTQQTRRAPRRMRSAHSSVAVVDVAWMVVAAALLLAIGVTGLLWLS
jgi:hypothetical protein